MPPDNAATVAPGTDVSFPQDGPNSGSGIVRSGPDSFILGEIGTYQVFFQANVTEAGQLILTLNGEDLEYTVVGRASGTSQIVELAIVETTDGDQLHFDCAKSCRKCCSINHHPACRRHQTCFRTLGNHTNPITN